LLDSTQSAFLARAFGSLVQVARKRGISDQPLAEWLLSLSVRWLNAHGVSAANVHTWVDRELSGGRVIVPLVAAAAAKNDFGGDRR
jgi:hypothetical protein